MRNLKLNGTDKAKVSGTYGETVANATAEKLRALVPGWLKFSYRHSGRRINRGGWFLRRRSLVGTHAYLRTIVLRHLGTIQGLRPREAEAVHQSLATGARALAERPARGYRLVEDGAHGGVDRAEEETKIRAALHLHERHVLVHLLAGVLLLLVIHQVRHDRLVVRDVQAEVDGDGLAAAVMRKRITAAVQSGGGMQGGGDSHHAGQNHADHRRPEHLRPPLRTTRTTRTTLQHSRPALLIVDVRAEHSEIYANANEGEVQ